jgi:hypothetical protein
MSTLSLTYVELAERLGISVDGARMKVKRAGWKKTKGNDGAVRVNVEESELIPSERSPNVKGTFPDHTTEQVRALEGHIVSLREQVEHLQQQLGRAEATAASERERVADLTAQLLKLTADMMALHQAQARPWWRRLAG